MTDEAANTVSSSTVATPAAAAPAVDSTPSAAVVASSQEAAPGVESPAAEPSVEDILRFDPFSSEKGDKRGNAAPVKKTEKSVSGDGGSATTVSKPPEQQTSQSQTANPELELMKTQLKEAQDTLAAMKQLAQNQPAVQQSAVQSVDDLPRYNYSIPKQDIALLTSENPEDVARGIANVGTGVSRVVHKTLREEIVTKIAPAIIRLAVEAVEQKNASQKQVTDIRTDFYKSYPEYDKPELHSVIGTVAKNLAEELHVQGYSPAFRDALGQRLGILFPQLRGSAIAAPVVQKPQPVILSGQQTRGAPSTETKQQQEIMDLMF